MINSCKKYSVLCLLSVLFFFAANSRADLWCTAYYPGYEQGTLAASNIDYTAITHIVHFSIFPAANGSIDANANVITTSGTSNILHYAHLAGKKVLICLGGQGSSFASVTNPTYLSNLVSNTVAFMHTNNYDGVDLDWEPVESTDQTGFTNLVVKMRAALNAYTPHPLFTIAMPETFPTSIGPAILGLVKMNFDQINLQTYDFSGAYSGWYTWFNSPIYDTGSTFPNNGGSPPSIDGMVNLYLTNGFTAKTLGIGIPFEGYIWAGGTTTSNSSGVSVPRQQWNTAPTVTGGQKYNYLSTNYSTNLYHWDTTAQAAYYSITNSGANNQFVSFDDARACQSKVSYARNHGLGGVILFELADDHTSSGPDPLLSAVKQALSTPGNMTIQRSGPSNILNFASTPSGSYRVQWSSNVTSGVWNSLAVTNITGTNITVQILDPTNQPRRFYRVQTPQ